MEVRAITRYLPISPQKLRLVCDKVRAWMRREALIVLDYMPQKGSAFVSKTLNSAMANAANNFDLNPEIWLYRRLMPATDLP